MAFHHVSVLPKEVIDFLAPHSGGIYVDGTLGGGGHTELLLKAAAPDGIVIGIDKDVNALEAAGARLKSFASRLHLVHGDFAGLVSILQRLGISGIDGLILDLGVSSHQLDTAERGFSFLQEAPLDMRMDRSTGETAADLVNRLDDEELTAILKDFGEERWARRIALRIVEERTREPITSTTRLVDIVKGAIPRGAWEDRIHPATRTFQALRIAVNNELGSLEAALADGIKVLNPGGRLVIISFHSLEDRIVKLALRDQARGCTCPPAFPRCVCGRTPIVKVLTSRPVMASADEITTNIRARSAKLRAAEKL
jgi:16S rRNA (cytosine1402-N4)-methyltransferase